MRGRVAAGQDNMGGTAADRLDEAFADTLGGVGGDEDMNHFSGGGTQETYADTNDSNVNAGGWMMKGGANVQPTIILNYIIKT